MPEELAYTCTQLLCSVRVDAKILHGRAWCGLISEPGEREGWDWQSRMVGMHFLHKQEFPEAFSKGAPAKAQDRGQKVGAKPQMRDSNELFMQEDENCAFLLPFIQCSVL